MIYGVEFFEMSADKLHVCYCHKKVNTTFEILNFKRKYSLIIDDNALCKYYIYHTRTYLINSYSYSNDRILCLQMSNYYFNKHFTTSLSKFRKMKLEKIELSNN